MTSLNGKNMDFTRKPGIFALAELAWYNFYLQRLQIWNLEKHGNFCYLV